MEIRHHIVVRELQLVEAVALRFHSNKLENRRSSNIAMLKVIGPPDVPQILSVFGKIFNGSLVRKSLMDLIHMDFIILAALCFEVYVQLPDFLRIGGTHIVKPVDNCEKTAPMFDEELEAVLSVEASETLGACLPACTKETGTDHHILETVEAISPLRVSFAWALLTSGEDRVLPGSNEIIYLVANFTRQILERKGTDRQISRCSGSVKVFAKRYTD